MMPAVCRSMLLLLMRCTWKFVHYFYEPPVSFQHVQRSKFCVSRFFGGPSSTHSCECSRTGCRSRREFHSQVTRHRWTVPIHPSGLLSRLKQQQLRSHFGSSFGSSCGPCVTFVFALLLSCDFMLASVRDANASGAVRRRQRRLRQWPLPRTTTTQLHGDRRWQGPAGRRVTR